MSNYHTTLNYILFAILIVMLLNCLYSKHSTEAFGYHDSSLSTGPFRADPTPPYTTSVHSSLPDKHRENTAYKYVAPFQSACTYTKTNTTLQCPKNQRFVCHLDGHNRRVCHWE